MSHTTNLARDDFDVIQRYLYVTMASAMGSGRTVFAVARYSDILAAPSLDPPPSLSRSSFHSSPKSIEYLASTEARYLVNVFEPSGTTKNFM